MSICRLHLGREKNHKEGPISRTISIAFADLFQTLRPIRRDETTFAREITESGREEGCYDIKLRCVEPRLIGISATCARLTVRSRSAQWETRLISPPRGRSQEQERVFIILEPLVGMFSSSARPEGHRPLSPR
jgi:hypothetical protein